MNDRRRRVLGNPYRQCISDTLSLSQYAAVADNATLSMGTGVRMSICAWINMATVAASQEIVTKGRVSGGFGTFEYALVYNLGSTRFRFNVSTGVTGAVRELTTISPVVAGVWNFIVGTYDGTNMNISGNGGAFDSGAYSSDIVDGTNAFRIGADAAAANPFDGKIAMVGIWKRAISIGEVQQMYGMRYDLRLDRLGSIANSLVGWWSGNGNYEDRSTGGNWLAPTHNPWFAPFPF